MIENLAIWKLILGGFLIASFSFLGGFFFGAVLNQKFQPSNQEEKRNEGGAS